MFYFATALLLAWLALGVYAALVVPLLLILREEMYWFLVEYLVLLHTLFFRAYALMLVVFIVVPLTVVGLVAYHDLMFLLALLVVVGYVVVFIGLSLLVMKVHESQFGSLPGTIDQDE